MLVLFVPQMYIRNCKEQLAKEPIWVCTFLFMLWEECWLVS